MRGKIFLILALVCSLSLFTFFVITKNYNTYVVTWYQPTETTKPVNWPVSFPYWTKATYPNIGMHQMTAILHGTKTGIMENILRNYPEACMLSIDHAPYYSPPATWVYPEWWDEQEWEIIQ